MEMNDKLKKESILFGKIFLVTVVIHWFIMFLTFFLMGDAGTYGINVFKAFYDKFYSYADTEHYLRIAENWYTATGEHCNNIVFYPLFPFLMKVLGFVIKDYFVAGAIISNICVGVSGYYLYKLTSIEIGEEKAMDSILLYLVYPFSVFTIMAYTESLSMMLVFMCLYAIKKNKWGIAGITGLLATLTKSQCIALFVPAVYEAVLYMIRQKKFKAGSLCVLLIPCGTGLYLLMNKIIQGDWFAFVKHQETEPWYNKAHWISENISQHVGMAKEYFSLGIIIYWAQIILYFIVIGALFYGLKKKISTSMIAFGGAYIFLSFIHGWLISGGRYVMGCATMYIIYASIENKCIKTLIMFACAVLNIFITIGVWQQQAIM